MSNHCDKIQLQNPQNPREACEVRMVHEASARHPRCIRARSAKNSREIPEGSAEFAEVHEVREKPTEVREIRRVPARRTAASQEPRCGVADLAGDSQGLRRGASQEPRMEPCMGPRKGSAAASQEPRCGLAHLASNPRDSRGLSRPLKSRRLLEETVHRLRRTFAETRRTFKGPSQEAMQRA